ncbi:hypothetical protein LCGC14_2017240 [marine sediment metagenome]|uniref:Uncharacterized protein n=1 Tax=marine sediment metagenome TaxID=412755 RepID=A0A0F9EYR0_9ZZZZ
MSLFKVHANWPDWMVKYLEGEIAKSKDGVFTIEVPPHNPWPGKELGEAFSYKRDKELVALLDEVKE